LTEGETFDAAIENVQDALAAVIELYHDLGRSLPPGLLIADSTGPIHAEVLVSAP
jgi:antitoxin HicB